MVKHWNNALTKQNCITQNQICSEITPEEEYRKLNGLIHLSI